MPDTTITPVQHAPDAERRFGGMARLYGTNALRCFNNAHVMVIGIGGVGSWAVEALARSGVGRLTLVDLDHVAESNINRQIHALDDTLGAAKVQVMADRISGINPGCRIETVEDFANAKNIRSLLERQPDAVVDCIDSFRPKTEIIAACRRNKTWIITVGAAGGRTDPTRIQCGDLSRTEHDALLSRVRKTLRQQHGFPRNLKRRFDVPCVWSDEQPVYPDGDGGIGPRPPVGAQATGLSCAAGIGSATHVTAVFGLAAVGRVLARLSRPR